jgi:hypothetical protein
MTNEIVPYAGVQQSSNVVAGHLAGRDVNQQIITNLPPPTPLGFITRLNQDLATEQVISPEEREFIEALQHYMVNRTLSVGLDEKLRSGMWEDDERMYAMELKERFAKTVQRRRSSETAQKILAHLLSTIRNLFECHVRPLVKSGGQRSLVRTTTYSDVVQPALKELEANRLDLTNDDILGGLYFLTGNCHVKWSP